MSLVQCPGCEQEIYPVKQPTQGGGKKLSCPRCQCALPATILDAEQATLDPAPRIISMQARQSPANPIPIEAAPAPFDPEAQIRARLDYIDGRLAELEPLREERAKLRRMLDAAAPPSAKRATA